MNKLEVGSLRGQQMLSYLPEYYEHSRVIRADMYAKGTELDALDRALNETLDQFFVRTATWGLRHWEEELGIPVETAKPLEQRRSLVESKLRGAGKFTGQLVKKVAESYHGGAVDISFQPERWSFTVKFVDTVGIPPNLDDLRAVLEDLKPAHMAIEYEFNYLLIRDIDGVMTLNELEQVELKNFAGGGSIG